MEFEKVKKKLREISLAVVAPVLSAVFLTAGALGSATTCSAKTVDWDRMDKGPDVYLWLNNHDTKGRDLSGQMSLPADKWYYDKADDGSYHMEFKLAGDKNKTTRNIYS